ncbi:twin-arginine translocation pathway signal [Bradyrhizobium sp. 186]|uniref:twin-arginine translocation pathway signal n=1 Tax=Bradyrhizobium sp. 186 TaxID=2782654 RepID=UPI00200189C5|nr:twin-arginine translocation pathway signal [Bradyrhizobium sp. 186]UPK32899.1 twin-arginine translocation pathway signal [Bradyrhizobium sp. 186]
MPVSFLHHRRSARVLLPLLGLCAALGGCASVSDTISPAFVDPARYDLWDCKQLAPERKNLVKRVEDLERLMAKAETGTGGVVVAELAYRNDYIAVRGQQKLMEETWRKNRCRESDMEAATPPAQPTFVPAPKSEAKPAPGSKSGGAVH